MTCQYVELQLNALADHELPPWQASRVRRHLAACRACAAEYADIQRLDASVQAWQDVPAPPALGPRILAALPPPAMFQTRRRAFPLRPAAVGLAGVAAAVAAAIWFLPGQPGEPTIAYADVVKAMANVKTATWTQELTMYDATGKIKIHQVQQVWVRRNPAAIATVTFPDLMHPQKRQSLEDARGRITLQPNGDYVLRENSHEVSFDVQEDLSTFGAILSPATKSGIGLDRAAMKRTVLDGQPALRFTQTFHYKSSPQVMAETWSKVWINEKIKRYVKMEIQTNHNGKRWMLTAVKSIQYDTAPPTGFFDIVPPPGAKVLDKRRRVQQK